jgi:hypothetical protein
MRDANCGDPLPLLSVRQQWLCEWAPCVSSGEVTRMRRTKKRETSCGALLFCALVRPRKRPSVTQKRTRVTLMGC